MESQRTEEIRNGWGSAQDKAGCGNRAAGAGTSTHLHSRAATCTAFPGSPGRRTGNTAGPGSPWCLRGSSAGGQRGREGQVGPPPAPLLLGRSVPSPPTASPSPQQLRTGVWAPRAPELSPAGALGCLRGGCHSGWEVRKVGGAPAGGCPGDWEVSKVGGPRSWHPHPAGFTSVWQERWLRAGPTQLEPPSLLRMRTLGRPEPRELTPPPPPRALLQATLGRGGVPTHRSPQVGIMSPVFILGKARLRSLSWSSFNSGLPCLL